MDAHLHRPMFINLQPLQLHTEGAQMVKDLKLKEQGSRSRCQEIKHSGLWE